MALAQRALVSNCHAIGCRNWITPDGVFCERHDAMLQSDIKALIAKHYRPGRPSSKVFAMWLEQAQQEILYAQTAGHKFPRAGSFEW